MMSMLLSDIALNPSADRRTALFADDNGGTLLSIA